MKWTQNEHILRLQNTGDILVYYQELWHYWMCHSGEHYVVRSFVAWEKLDCYCILHTTITYNLVKFTAFRDILQST